MREGGGTGDEQSDDQNSRDFFFQAEDGIRDSPVTGVQTCALPIWMPQLLLLLYLSVSYEQFVYPVF